MYIYVPLGAALVLQIVVWGEEVVVVVLMVVVEPVLPLWQACLFNMLCVYVYMCVN